MHRHNNSLNLCLKNFLLVTTFNLLYLELPHYIQPVRTLMTLNQIRIRCVHFPLYRTYSIPTDPCELTVAWLRSLDLVDRFFGGFFWLEPSLATDSWAPVWGNISPNELCMKSQRWNTISGSHTRTPNTPHTNHMCYLTLQNISFIKIWTNVQRFLVVLLVWPSGRRQRNFCLYWSLLAGRVPVLSLMRYRDRTRVVGNNNYRPSSSPVHNVYL